MPRWWPAAGGNAASSAARNWTSTRERGSSARDSGRCTRAMAGLPLAIRFIDPPLHEFVSIDSKQTAALARVLKVLPSRVAARIAQLHEQNPMLGHRGCRLRITYPEISAMQARAVFQAT